VPSVVAHNSLALDQVAPRVHNATKRDYKVAARLAGTKERLGKTCKTLKEKAL
jgi:hypothetical protein